MSAPRRDDAIASPKIAALLAFGDLTLVNIPLALSSVMARYVFARS
jgi:hypothetical protein